MKLGIEEINYINVFARLTHSNVKDCIIEQDKLIFVVWGPDITKAIGKAGSNIRKARAIFKKDIHVVAYDANIIKFVANLLYPLKVDNITLEGKTIKITVEDSSIKGKIFGRSRENLKRIQDITKRHFNIEEIRVS